jgi:hypothetical protein
MASGLLAHRSSASALAISRGARDVKRFGNLLLHLAGFAQRSTLFAADSRVPFSIESLGWLDEDALQSSPMN